MTTPASSTHSASIPSTEPPTPEQPDHKERLMSALLAMRELRAKVTELENARHEPLAIVGMGCRLPGNVNSPDMYWSLLKEGIDATQQVPAERGWNLEQLYAADPDTPGKLYVSKGGFLANVDRFDAAFFGIPPREATHLDPQQRLLLEVSWEALEHAGIDPHHLRGSLTGAFIGMTTNDYLQMQARATDLTAIDAYTITGNHLNAAAGRLSYTFGLQGPSMAIDTACSSSLVAIHLACQSLRQGGCDMALAGGVNLALSPDGFVAASRARMLSPDGRCKTFDAGADGYARGEGCGVIVLKRLKDAIAQGDTVLAVIRGSAVNQDGPSSGLTAPNGPAQQQVIRQALQNGGVSAEQISYVEAHGTGTALGDPIEIEALAAELCKTRSPEQPLIVGAAKTNLGHLEPAAGIAGLIKLVLSLQHQAIPPNLNFEQPNPHIPWEQLPITIPTALTPWRSDEEPRRAGISGFGVSGTNAHLILEEAPPAPAANFLPSSPAERPLHLLSLSAKSETALQQLASRYELWLLTQDDAQPAVRLADLCFSANTTRARFKHRLTLVSATSDQLAQQLTAFSARQPSPGVFKGTAIESPKIAFLFTGEGKPFMQMGRQLYQNQPAFRQALLDCAEILRSHLPTPLVEVLYPNTPAQVPLMDQPLYAQPVLFALEYALCQLWQAWGITPDWVLGQGAGEYAAACTAGLCSLEDALLRVTKRARLAQQLSEATTTSERQRVEALLADLAQRPIGSAGRPLQCGLISNATGKPVTDGDLTSGEAGRLPLSPSATFELGITTLQQQGCQVFLEIGPHTALVDRGQAILPEADATWLSSLKRDQSAWSVLLESAAILSTRGIDLDWASFDHGYSRTRLTLPTYPFERKQFWVNLPDTAVNQPPQVTASHRSADDSINENTPENLEQRVITLAAEITGIQPQHIGLLQTLEGALGLDSIMLTQLMNGLIKLVPESAKKAFEQQASLQEMIQMPHLQAVIDFLQPWQTFADDEGAVPSSELAPTAGAVTTEVAPLAGEPVEILHGQYFHLIGHWLVNSTSLFATVQLEGDFDLAIAQQAWQDLLERHPMLRSRFHIPADAERFSDYQLAVLPQVQAPAIAFKDLRQANIEAQLSAIEAERQYWLNYAWSLSQWPLHQFSVIQLKDKTFQLFLGNEHVISDGLGNHIILHEFLELYRARVQNEAPQLPPATTLADYKDTVAAMNAAVEPEAQAALSEYIQTAGKTAYCWNPDGKEFSFSLPTYHSRPYQLDRQTTRQLISRTRDWQLPLNSLLTGAFMRALSQCDPAAEQMILQIPTGGRVYPDVDASTQVSSFAQNLAIGFERTNPQESWQALLQRVHQSIQTYLTRGLDHAQTQKMGGIFRDSIPLEAGQVNTYSLSMFHGAIKSNVYLPYTGRTPIQTQYGSMGVTTYQAGGINAAGILDILQEIFDDRLNLFASYDSDFFSSETIERLMLAYQQQLVALAAFTPPPIETAQPDLTATLDDQIATLLQSVAADICHTPIHPQDLALDLEADLGFDSLERIRLVAQLERQGYKADRKQLLACRTLQAMGQHLQATAAVAIA